MTNLIANGWSVDEADPADGRKKIIGLSDQSVGGGLWRVIVDWIEDYPVHGRWVDPYLSSPPVSAVDRAAAIAGRSERG